MNQPTQGDPAIDTSIDLEQYLLTWWGREGRVGYGIICEMIDLSKKFDKYELYYAIQQAAKSGKKSLFYVKKTMEGRSNEKRRTENKGKELEQMIFCSDCNKQHPANYFCEWGEKPWKGIK